MEVVPRIEENREQQMNRVVRWPCSGQITGAVNVYLKIIKRKSWLRKSFDPRKLQIGFGFQLPQAIRKLPGSCQNVFEQVAPCPNRVRLSRGLSKPVPFSEVAKPDLLFSSFQKGNALQYFPGVSMRMANQRSRAQFPVPGVKFLDGDRPIGNRKRIGGSGHESWEATSCCRNPNDK